MPTPKTPPDLLQQALNWVEEFGSGYLAKKVIKTDVPERTIDARAKTARLAGMRPTVRKDAPRVYTKQRLGKMHLIIPDVQMKHGVRDDHMTWIGNFISEKQPDEVICIGDFADMESLNSYSKAAEREGKRYVKDIAAVQGAQRKLWKPLEDWNRTAKRQYQPNKTFTQGNHEYRIVRFVDDHPEFEGKVSLDDLGYEDFGWKVYPYLRIVKIDGVEYSHFFTSGVKGNPCSSAAVQLRERQRSSIAGHVQHTDIAMHKKTQQTAIFCGTCYLHDERYLGEQDNCQRRQILVLHEVEEGRFDPMFVSLKFLEKSYS